MYLVACLVDRFLLHFRRIEGAVIALAKTPAVMSFKRSFSIVHTNEKKGNDRRSPPSYHYGQKEIILFTGLVK